MSRHTLSLLCSSHVFFPFSQAASVAILLYSLVSDIRSVLGGFLGPCGPRNLMKITLG